MMDTKFIENAQYGKTEVLDIVLRLLDMVMFMSAFIASLYKKHTNNMATRTVLARAVQMLLNRYHQILLLPNPLSVLLEMLHI